MILVPDSWGAALQERRKAAIPNDPDSRFTHVAQRCHKHVKRKSPGVNPYAVCNTSVGTRRAYRKYAGRNS